jgi:micrococcal nuclease
MGAWRRRGRGGGLVGLVACAAVGLGAVLGNAWSAGRVAPESVAVVDHVVDGDTIDVRVAGRFERVRTVQIDAPESSSTRFGRPDRCGAPASAYAHTLTRPGARVWLERSGRETIDRYGRLLALVHLGSADGVTWQERMVRAGWAEVLVYRGNTTRLLGVLEADQAYAKAHDLGVYRRCGGSFHDGGG